MKTLFFIIGRIRNGILEGIPSQLEKKKKRRTLVLKALLVGIDIEMFPAGCPQLSFPLNVRV